MCILVKYWTIYKKQNRESNDLHLSLLKTIILEMSILYFDIFILDKCQEFSEEELDKWQTLSLTFQTIENTMIMCLCFHIICGNKIIRVQLERWQLFLICTVCLMSCSIDFVTMLIPQNSWLFLIFNQDITESSTVILRFYFNAFLLMA